MDACEGAGAHLLHGVGWGCDEGGYIAVLDAIEVGLNGLGRVPPGLEERFVGVAFG